MKPGTRIGIAIPTLILGLAALAYLSGYLLPTKTHIEWATYIDAAPRVVYGLINDLRQFKQWTPWHDLAPNSQYDVELPQRGLGAAMRWNSEDSNVGTGRLVIIDAQPDNKLRILLEYNNSEQAVLAFRFEPLEGGTHIVWSLDIDHGTDPFSRYRGWLVKRRLETIFEPGLDRLRRLSERQTTPPALNIVAEEVTYHINNELFTGYLAYDQNRFGRPGLLIMHDRWGLNETLRNRAEQLAELGYTAFALDLYGQGKEAASPEQADQLSREIIEQPDIANQRIIAALDVLKGQSTTDSGNVAAIGYGMGGTLALNMARMGISLDGVVSFYGDLSPLEDLAKKGQVEASLLILNGADDITITTEARQAFIDEMDIAGVDYEFINYPGAEHGFADPMSDEYARQFQLPLAYAVSADKNAWQKMRAFLARIFE